VSNLTVGSACECIFSERVPRMYDAWVVRFRDLTHPDRIIEVSCEYDPGVQVGRRYRLVVTPEELD
jgi:hypothetical protein